MNYIFRIRPRTKEETITIQAPDYRTAYEKLTKMLKEKYPDKDIRDFVVTLHSYTPHITGVK